MVITNAYIDGLNLVFFIGSIKNGGAETNLTLLKLLYEEWIHTKVFERPTYTYELLKSS